MNETLPGYSQTPSLPAKQLPQCRVALSRCQQIRLDPKLPEIANRVDAPFNFRVPGGAAMNLP
jgi:hypothetical protein